MASLSDTNKEEVEMDAKRGQSQKQGPLRIDLRKKGERSGSTSKVHTSRKVSFHLPFNVTIVRIPIIVFRELNMLDPMRMS